MKNIRFIKSFLVMSLLFVFLFGTFVYVIDPLQQYREATYSPLFSGKERYQNPGLAKNYTYDMIILGSSMTENFIPSNVGELLGGNVLKLSMEGSTSTEQRLIADVAINTNQVKKALWGLDYFAVREDSVRDEDTFPFYLYDDSQFNDYKYIFNISNVAHALKAIFLPKDRFQHYRNLELLNNWDSEAEYGADHVLAKWKQAKLYEQISAEIEPPIEEVEQRFDDTILSLVKAHPEIEFIFYYPPYSVIRQQVWYSHNPERFTNQLEMKQYIYEKFSNLDNVSLYDFQSDSSITYDLNVYKDLSHHSGAINQLILEEIAAGTHRVTEDNVNRNNTLLEQQVENLIINENGSVFSLFISIDGEPVDMNQLSTTANNEVRVPLKDFALISGVEFNYNTASKKATLTRGDQEVVFHVGELTASLNGQNITIESPAEIVQGRLVIPLISVVSLLGGEVTITQNEPYPYFINYDLSFK